MIYVLLIAAIIMELCLSAMTAFFIIAICLDMADKKRTPTKDEWRMR